MPCRRIASAAVIVVVVVVDEDGDCDDGVSEASAAFFSTSRFRSQRFSSCRVEIFFSRSLTRSAISLAAFSMAWSRCFFLMRKRADAAVLRRRLSSSAATRADSWIRRMCASCSELAVPGW